MNWILKEQYEGSKKQRFFFCKRTNKIDKTLVNLSKGMKEKNPNL